MVAEVYIRWRHAETGQWFVTQTDHSTSRPCPVAITRPIYPDHPMPIVPAREPKKAERAAPPVPVAVAVGLEEAWLPSTARSAIRTAQQHGWECRLTRATAGETYTLGLRCDLDGIGGVEPRRVAFAWKWKLVTRSPKGRPSYQEYAWSADGAWIMPPMLPVGTREATQALADFDAVRDRLAGQMAMASR